jgi:hypothetical protein
MRKIGLIVPFLFSMFAAPLAMAQSTATGFIAVPASGFVDAKLGPASRFNLTGTTQFFNVMLFAPVSLPHGYTITSFKCGGKSFFNRSVVFTLRRNDPQQQNVDIATVKTTLEGTGFEFVETSSITSGKIDNSRFNYYIVVDVEDNRNLPNIDVFCPDNGNPKCSVGFCSVGYSQ